MMRKLSRPRSRPRMRLASVRRHQRWQKRWMQHRMRCLHRLTHTSPSRAGAFTCARVRQWADRRSPSHPPYLRALDHLHLHPLRIPYSRWLHLSHFTHSHPHAHLSHSQCDSPPTLTRTRTVFPGASQPLFIVPAYYTSLSLLPQLHVRKHRHLQLTTHFVP